MNQEKAIESALQFAKSLLEGDATGHGYDHIERVVRNARQILSTEKADSFAVLLAAALHDVDDVKLFPQNRNQENARSFLSTLGLDEETRERVLTLIREVSFKGKDSCVPATIEGKIVQDADRLDAIGAIGIARAFAFGGAHGRPLYEERPMVLTALSEEEYRSRKSATITHFYEKLLFLKDMMNTGEGRRMAEERHRFLLLFLEQFSKETGYGR